MSAEAKWSYYTASYIKIEPTETVRLDEGFNMPFLRRNIPKEDEELENSSRAVPTAYEDALELRICVNSYKILWEPQTSDYFVQDPTAAVEDGDEAPDLERARQSRKTKFVEQMVTSNAWMKNLGGEEIERLKAKFMSLVRDVEPTTEENEEAAPPDTGDQMVTDA